MRLAFRLTFAAILAFSAVALSNGHSCNMALLQPPQPPKEAAWRTSPNSSELQKYMAQTNPNQSGGYSKTNKAREKEIKNYCKDAIEEIWINDIDAYGMVIFPEVGTKLEMIESPGDYGSGKTGLYVAQNISPDGKLRVTLTLPVSGRFGQATTKKWATTDLFSIYMTDTSGNKTVLMSKTKSLDIVTVQELEIPLVQNQEIKIYYDREGSAGPFGFPEGRIMRIIWDGSSQKK